MADETTDGDLPRTQDVKISTGLRAGVISGNPTCLLGGQTIVKDDSSGFTVHMLCGASTISLDLE